MFGRSIALFKLIGCQVGLDWPPSTALAPGSRRAKLSPRGLERVKGIEPSTRSLGSFCSTTELHPRRPHF
jgi:hypothetical protein